VEAFKQAQIDQSATFNGTPYLVAATLFVAITIPLARFTDWLITRDRMRQQSGSWHDPGTPSGCTSPRGWRCCADRPRSGDTRSCA
jgi:hypothetical protein